MAKHKAPTSITIASTTDRNAMHDFVDRYWKLALLFAGAITVGILARQWIDQKSQASAGESWARLRQEVSFGGEPNPNGFQNPHQVTFPAPAVLASLAEELAGDDSGAWAKVLEVGQLLRTGDKDGAKNALSELEEGWPDHIAVTLPMPFDQSGEPCLLADFVRQRVDEIDAWEAAHPTLFANPPVPEGSPKVRFKTAEGEITLGLYQDEAPKHVANFLKLCGEGYYNGTRFHRIVRGSLIQGGDPNSIAGEPETWGLGGPEEKIDAEPNGLRHFPYVLAAARSAGDPRSSGSQFYITVSSQHDFDEQYVVFGAVLEGNEVADAIASGTAVGETPQDPVILELAEVLP
jgi:cyclophilin family peptidyl-prolyl cis-trans isomerase